MKNAGQKKNEDYVDLDDSFEGGDYDLSDEEDINKKSTKKLNKSAIDDDKGFKSPPQYVRKYTAQQPDQNRDFDTYVSSHSSLWTKDDIIGK